MEQKMIPFVLVRWTAYLKPETMKQKMKLSTSSRWKIKKPTVT